MNVVSPYSLVHRVLCCSFVTDGEWSASITSLQKWRTDWKFITTVQGVWRWLLCYRCWKFSWRVSSSDPLTTSVMHACLSLKGEGIFRRPAILKEIGNISDVRLWLMFWVKDGMIIWHCSHWKVGWDWVKHVCWVYT